MTASETHNLIPNMLFQVALIWGTSKVFNNVLSRFKLPAVLGELFCGVLFGVLLIFLPRDWWFAAQLDGIRHSEILFALGELGIILLLFEVGLETEISKVMSVGKEALCVALGGVVAPFLFAWFINWAFNLNWSVNLILFVGLVLAATSIGVTARVFQDLKVLQSFNAQIVLGAAVLDDILGLILLSVISALVSNGSQALSWWPLALLFLKATVFLGFSIWLGDIVSTKFLAWMNRWSKQDQLGFMLWILTFAFLLAYLASLAGLAPIIGAFAAGITLDRVKIEGLFGETKSVEDYIAPIRAVFAPIFFVKVGLAIDPTTLWNWLPWLLTLVACASKLVSGWLFVPFKTDMNRLLVGVGMMPRGEVGLVVAAIGNSIGLLTESLYSAVLVAVIMTTVIAPFWLQFLLRPKTLTQKQ